VLAVPGRGCPGVDLALAPRPERVGVARSLPAVVGLGTPATLSWTVHNPCDRLLVVRIADELAPSLCASARRARVRVPAGRSVTLRVGLAPTRRGRFVPGELVVRVEGPWGSWPARPGGTCPASSGSIPVFGSRRQADLRIERARILEVGLRSARAKGVARSSTSYANTGSTTDSRRIDWAATARSDRPIVRTYRGRAQPKGHLPSRQRAHHGRPGRRGSPGGACHRRRDDAHIGGGAYGRYARPGRFRPRRPGRGTTPVGARPASECDRGPVRPGTSTLPERLPGRVSPRCSPFPTSGPCCAC